MSAEFPAGLYLEGIARQSARDAVEMGIKGLVWLYYDEYSDATDLEMDELRAIQHFADIAGIDSVEVIIEAEREINDNGGMRSDTTGERHTVKTAHLYTDDAQEG